MPITERTLEADLEILTDFFRKWRSCPNMEKMANSKIEATFNEGQLQPNFHPVYLGHTLDGSPTHNGNVT